MELIIKRSIKAFWNTEDWPQNPTSFDFCFGAVLFRDRLPYWLSTQLDIPENKGDSKKLEKVQELVQHFREYADIIHQNKI